MNKIFVSLAILLAGLAVVYFLLHRPTGPSANTAVRYSYTDGNNNRYLITNDGQQTMEYIPVPPEQSGTGEYSGGEYQQKNLTAEQYKAIIQKFTAGLATSSAHSELRVKGSGLVKIEKNSGTQTYILKPDSVELKQLEKLLKNFISR